MSIAYLREVPLHIRLEAVRQLSLVGEDPGPLLDAALDPGEASAVVGDDLDFEIPTCRHGHPWTPENTYINPSNGGRVCRECHRSNHRRYRLSPEYRERERERHKEARQRARFQGVLVDAFCKRGHLRSEANTYHHPNGSKKCRECIRLNEAKRRPR